MNPRRAELLDHPAVATIDVQRYHRNRPILDAWLDEHRPGWRDERILRLGHADGVTLVERCELSPVGCCLLVDGDLAVEYVEWRGAPSFPDIGL